jgi:periplasmic protein TonB
MKAILSFWLLLLCAHSIKAEQSLALDFQRDTVISKVDKDLLFHIVEAMPEFPGGQEAMLKFIAERIVYPEEAIEGDIEGTVVIEFIVERDGSLTHLKIIKDIGGGCGEAALDVIRQMPNWKPGTQRDVPVRVVMLAPLRFKLQNAPKKKKR